MSSLFRILAVISLALTLPFASCDAGDGGGGDAGSDCRMAAYACASGFTCEEGTGGAFACVSNDASSSGGGGDNGGNGSGNGSGSDGSDGSGTGGNGTGEPSEPSTDCLYAYGSEELTSDFGVGCETPEECAHGVCMMPGATGNITNEVFGFCSRGCDCDDAGDASLSGDDPDYDCAYPGGCWVGQSQGAWRHVVLKCSSVGDCQEVDSRYTHCEYTGNLTVIDGENCGGITKVCQAHL